MFNYFRVNLNIMIKQKTFLFSISLMLILCLSLPYIYFFYYKNNYDYQLPASYSLFIGNEMGLAWKYIQLLIPFLILFPFSMSFYNDYLSGSYIYYQTRYTRKKYYIAQVLTCFVGGAIIIAIPFMLNIILNSIIFPGNGNDYITTLDKYFTGWSESVTGSNVVFKTTSNGLILKSIYTDFPQLYNVILTVFASIVSGIMAVAAYCFSLIIHKSRIFMFLFSYMFFQLFSMIDSVLYDRWSENNLYVCTNISSYMSFLPGQLGKNYMLFGVFLIFLIVCEIAIIINQIKKDQI